MKEKRKLVFFIIIVSFLFTFMAYAEKKNCKKPIVVQAEVIKGEHYKKILTETSSVYLKTFNISSPINGVVKNLKVSEEDSISKGVVLMEIEDEETLNKIKETDALVKKWKRILWKREHWKVRSEKAEDQAKRKIAEFKKQLDELKNKKTKVEIKSAFSGAIKALLVKEGDKVSEGESLVNIERNDLVFVDFKNKDIVDFLKVKNKAVIVNIKRDGEIILNNVQALLFVEDKATLTYSIENGNLLIREGDLVELSIVVKEFEKAIFISPSYTRSDNKGVYVFVIRNGFPEKTYISLDRGTKKNGKVLVLSGLSEGDEIATTRIDCLSDGLKIIVIEKDPETGRWVLKKYKKKKVKKKKKTTAVIKKEGKEAKAIKKKEKVKKIEKKKAKKEEKKISGEKERKLWLSIKSGGFQPYYSFTLSHLNSFEYKNKLVGMSFGFSLDYNLNDKVGFGFATMFGVKKNSYLIVSSGSKDFSLDIEKSYVDVILFSKYNVLKKGNLKAYLLGGAFYSIKTSGSWDRIFNDTTILTYKDTDEYWGNKNIGGIIGLGTEYKIDKIRFTLEFIYEKGFTNICGPKFNEDIKINGMWFLFGIGYNLF